MPVIQFTPEFKRNLRTLAKKYHHIREDVEPVIAALQAGALPGDPNSRHWLHDFQSAGSQSRPCQEVRQALADRPGRAPGKTAAEMVIEDRGAW